MTVQACYRHKGSRELQMCCIWHHLNEVAVTSVDWYLRHMKHNQFDKSFTDSVHAVHEATRSTLEVLKLALMELGMKLRQSSHASCKRKADQQIDNRRPTT